MAKHNNNKKNGNNNKLNSNKKWEISALVAVLFFVVSFPLVYNLTNKLTNYANVETSSGGCPNYYGLALHTVVFLFAVRAMMEY